MVIMKTPVGSGKVGSLLCDAEPPMNEIGRAAPVLALYFGQRRET
jgi:hypothetical protein